MPIYLAAKIVIIFPYLDVKIRLEPIAFYFDTVVETLIKGIMF